MNDLWKRANYLLEMFRPVSFDASLIKRFGSENDGGYLVVDDLKSSDCLISMGVGNDINFEICLSGRVSEIHLYDHTIETLPSYISNGAFFRERIGGIGHTTIDDCIARFDAPKDLLLKVDIEGSEWECFDSVTSETLNSFRQIIVEFHWLEKIVEEDFFRVLTRVLEKLKSSHFVMNAHPNNWGEALLIENLLVPQVLEVTYLRRKSYSFDQRTQENLWDIEFFNRPCNPNVPEIYLLSSKDKRDTNLLTNSVGVVSRATIHNLGLERDGLIHERDGLIQERDGLIYERDGLIHERDGLIQERDGLIHERDGLIHERDGLIQERDGLIHELINCFNHLKAIEGSRIWRATKPYRKIRTTIRKIIFNNVFTSI